MDLPPEQLHQRLLDGKVYVPEKIDQAIGGFFKRSNLLALRELALRHTAEQVDKDLRQARTTQRQEDSWHAGERILVCVAPNQMAPRVVRAARRLASSLHSEMLAVTVESSRQRSISAKNRAYQEQAMALAEKLGARTSSLAADDIVAEVIAYARKENVSTIVMGKPVRPRWKELLFGSVVDAMIRSSGDIDVLVITGAEDQGTPIFRRPQPAKATAQGYIEAVLVIGFCTVIGAFIREQQHLSNIIMLYLLGTVGISIRNGIKESIFATFLSILAFDFFFVPPNLTFAVSDIQYIFTFCVMLIVSILLSSLTTRLTASSRAVSERERTTATLYELSRRLAESRKKDEMARLATEKVGEILGFPSAVVIRSEGQLKTLCHSTTHFEAELNELAVATWAIDHSQPAGKSTETLSGAKGCYLPLKGSNSTVGVLAVEAGQIESLDLNQRRLLDAVASQLAGALERANFAKDSLQAALQAESEQMRSDLLSAVSHDLRTPLASIQGSAAGLIEQPELSDTSKELAETIQDEAQRMGLLIRNLLDMTRVQGQVSLNLDWQSLNDLAANAVERTSPLFTHSVQINHPSETVVVQADGGLIEQVMVNLLENAARHAGKEAKVVIDLWQTEKEGGFKISDDGPGLKVGEESKVFERFHRSGREGFGLGLSICKAAVEAHKGTIVAINGNPGAIFEVKIPKEQIPE